MVERSFVRVLVAVALCLALLAIGVAPVPVDAKGNPDLPVTPAFSGLVRGRLPIEISIRGARFAEETGRSVERDEAAIKSLEKAAGNLEQRLSQTQLEIKRLNMAQAVTGHNRR